jgi:CHAT domain-containing protein
MLNGFRVDISFEKLFEIMKRFRELLTHPQSQNKSKNSKLKINEMANELYHILFEVVDSKIDVHRLYIVPHNILHYLPFEVLHDGNNFIINKYFILYLPSATAMKYIYNKRKRISPEVIAFGNPDTGDPSVPSLPSAEMEVKSIKGIYPESEIYIKNLAKERVFKQKAGLFNIVHIASHGEFNKLDPLLSCLCLSPGDGEDGRLETHEIFNLDLKSTSLVVMSCCNTAIGKLLKGDELIGLNRAFMYAGTPSIIGTLWSINDKATSHFMGLFYNFLRNYTKEKALQLAKIEFINNTEYSHPFFWAPFVLVGDWH